MQPKRIIIALLAVILVTLSVISISATSEVANEIAFTVEATASTALKAEGTSVTVKGQDIIEISVTVSEKNSDFSIIGLGYVLKYDTSLLEYVSCTNGNVCSMAYPNHQASEGKVHVSFLDNYTTGGVLATVAFRVKDGAHGTGAVVLESASITDTSWHDVPAVCVAKTVTVDAHTYGADAAASCTAGVTCAQCEAELVAALGHTPGAAATCTTNQTCTVCSTELAAALGHTPGAAATCTTAQTCTACSAELAPATGHSMGDWVTDKEPTTKEEGSKSQSCANCDHKVTESIPMLEASFPWWIIVIVVVVLVGGFACYWFFVVKKKED